MGVVDDTPATRISSGNFIRSPGTKVEWPGVPPREYRRQNPNEY